MTRNEHGFALRATVVALQGVMLALAADAEFARAQSVEELTRPATTVEVGAGYVTDDSYKFGEYNGLYRKGAYLIGGIDARGGGAYDSDSAFRWRVTGTDLGLRIREIIGEAGEQGRYRIDFGYNELRRNYSDTYITPYSGGGSDTLTLDGYPAASARPSTGANNWNNIQNPAPSDAILSRLHNFNVDTQRVQSSVGGAVFLTPQLQLTASAKHETKDGTKLTGTAFGGFRGALLPEPISYTTDQFDAALAWAGQNAHAQVGYYGSVFNNDIAVWTAANPFAGNAIAAAAGDRIYRGTMPDNQFHQLNLAGGYKFSPTTRLTMSASYGRGTQNAPFVITPTTGTVPEQSLHGEVIRKNVDLRLTMRPVRGLNLLVAYKYDDRDNRTSSNTYSHGEADAAGTTPHINEPLSKRVHQVNLEADYGFGRGQAVKGAYEWQRIERTCGGPEPDCFDTARTTENTLRAEYRNALTALLNARISYAYSQRRTSDYEDLTPSAGARRSFLTDRNRDKVRGAVNYQATDALALTGTLDFNRDDYSETRYGLKETRTWALNLDATYAFSENLSVTGYYTYEDLRSKIDGNAATPPGTAPIPAICGTINGTTQPLNADQDPCRDWFVTPSDKVHTLGAGLKQRGLLGGKLDLTADLTYSRARSPINMTGATYYSSGTQLVYVPATSFPDSTSRMIDLRLAGRYALDPTSAVRIAYQFRKLTAADWQWDAYAAAGITAVQAFIGPSFAGTGPLVAPRYDVHVIGVSYQKSFR
jgi:MtrB/PioB family decaheme-associated outer membrane protein